MKLNWRLLTIFFLFLHGLVVAQDAKPVERKRRFFNITQLGYNIGIGNYKFGDYGAESGI